MAKNFANSLRIPYQGVFSNTPIQLCGGANVVGFDFPWRQYGTYLGSNRTVAVNPGVTFTMAQPPQTILKSIQGVFIDNTNCSSPVYLECFDTKHVVACADNATAFFPLMTGGTEFTFYIESMETPWRGNQTTRILMMDTPVSPFAQQQASNRFITQAQISGLEQFSNIIIGDQIFAETRNIAPTRNETSFSATSVLIPSIENTTVILVGLVFTAGASFNNLVGGQGTINSNFGVRNDELTIATYSFNASQSGGGSVNRASTRLVDLSNFAVRLNGSKPLVFFFEGTKRQGDDANAGATFEIIYTRITNPTT